MPWVVETYLFEIFENFLALMGYWVTIFLVIVLEEHMIFRWGKIAQLLTGRFGQTEASCLWVWLPLQHS